MKSFVHEIHRRSLWQVLGIYLAGSWVALQVVETLSESMTLPDWVQGFSVILLILGLPVVLATAFVQEGVGRKPADRSGTDGGAAGAPADTSAPGGERVALAEEVGSLEDTAGESPVDSAAGQRADASRRPAGPHGILTWKRAIAGGVLAFALLGVVLVGWVIMRSLGVGPAGTLVAKGLIEERATLLLTDFISTDESLSRAATEAIRVDLGQSNIVKLADPGFVTAALDRMQRSPDGGLDVATGRDLAQREGMPAVIAGEVTSVGSGYVLTAQILTAETGEVLVADRVTAAGDDELIGAIDRLSSKLRERIGESLGDLATTPALESVTTADLAALRLYSRAVTLSDAGEQRQAVDLLEEAVALDTSFAMAWRKMGAIYTSGGGALGQQSRGIEAYARAYRFRDRLTERERLLTTAGYYLDVERDPRRAADAYEEMLEDDPDDTWALNNLGIIMGADLGDEDRARELLRRSIDLEPGTANGYWNLSVAQGRVGDYEAAGATLDEWKQNIPGDAMPYLFHAGLAGSIRDYDAMDSLAQLGRTIRPGNSLDVSFALGSLATSAHVRGRLAEGNRLSDETEESNLQLGPGRALQAALGRVQVELDVRSDRAEAMRLFDGALSRYPLDQMGPLDPPWLDLVVLDARLRGGSEARDRLDMWLAADPGAAATLAHDVAEAWIDLADGDPAGALRRLDGITDNRCLACAPRARLAAARSLGAADSVITYGEAYVGRPGLFRVYQDRSGLGPALEELGQRYDEISDLQNAVKYYAAFVELWAEADDELQPRVRAAQARLEEILQEIG